MYLGLAVEESPKQSSSWTSHTNLPAPAFNTCQHCFRKEVPNRVPVAFGTGCGRQFQTDFKLDTAVSTMQSSARNDAEVPPSAAPENLIHDDSRFREFRRYRRGTPACHKERHNYQSVLLLPELQRHACGVGEIAKMLAQPPPSIFC